MSFNTEWDCDKYKVENETDEQWQLRKEFMEKWKNSYPEDRLVCLGKVFANIEFLGCVYPPAVMEEVAKLSAEIAKPYRERKKEKLQRTFVSASTAAEDRAKGVKRTGGVVENPQQLKKILFVPQGQSVEEQESVEEQQPVEEQASTSSGAPSMVTNTLTRNVELNKKVDDRESRTNEINIEPKSSNVNLHDYRGELLKLNCLNVHSFRESMFYTRFGKIVLTIRPWVGKFSNLQASCQACGLQSKAVYKNSIFTFSINDNQICEAWGSTKAEAKTNLESHLWRSFSSSTVSILVKEQFIAQNDSRISVSDVSNKEAAPDDFGTPLDSSVAAKMMKMMGWKGGGLGADAQGIAEPIKPNLQLVNRAGLGSTASGLQDMRRASLALMDRYLASDTLDLDLVFSSEFSKEERATLHRCAQKKPGLVSRSHGSGDERFLVIRKRLDPFALVRAIIDKGGTTAKYEVFLPERLAQQPAAHPSAT